MVTETEKPTPPLRRLTGMQAERCHAPDPEDVLARFGGDADQCTHAPHHILEPLDRPLVHDGLVGHGVLHQGRDR